VIAIGELEPGPLNAITDVSGVRVGHTTLIKGEDVRTGVTVVLPAPDGAPCFAAPHRLNGNGELTGLEWVRESGLLTTPIGITNTFSVGVVRDALVTSQHRAKRGRWHLPVVGETYDGRLNDIEGMHVRAEHVFAAVEAAAAGEVDQGSVGGGTGMICHGFKGGIGTASRRADEHLVGVLVQANHGARSRLTIEGVPVGREIDAERVPLPTAPDNDPGSIIVSRDRRAAAAAPVRASRAARRSRHRAHRRRRRELKRRPRAGVRRRKPRSGGERQRGRSRERAAQPALLRRDRGDRGRDRPRLARRRDDDRPRGHHSAPSSPRRPPRRPEEIRA
jgi:D-aminopeptidase